MKPNSALLLVDLQNDFCPGGALAVPGGDEVIPLANRLQQQFDIVIATQDWHPQQHMSFASNHPGKRVGDIIEVDGIPQIMWPDHCVQDTFGAQLHPALDVSRITRVFHKGTNPCIDSYSAFFDNEKLQSTGLSAYLDKLGVKAVYILGLATDYCVKFSVLDALGCGYETLVIADACRAVNLQADDGEQAIAGMREAGATIL